jgi:hypothetical protein
MQLFGITSNLLLHVVVLLRYFFTYTFVVGYLGLQLLIQQL